MSFYLSLLLACFAFLFAAAQGAPAADAPRLRVALVGLTHGHAHQFFQQYKHHPEVEFVGAAEPDRDLAARYARQYNLPASLLFADAEDMIRKARPQAVLLYTSTFDHRRYVELCAGHHVHVMMEKPLATTVVDARAIVRAARDAGIHVLVNYETTWYASNRAAYDYATTGALGSPVRKIVVHDGHRGPKEIGVGPEFLAWLTDPKLNGAGALFDFGCYGADLATWLMAGQRPASVTAVTQHLKPDVYPHVDDEATVILTYPAAQAILQASWNWPYNRKDLEVYGTTGYAITVGPDAVRLLRDEKGGEQRVQPPPLPSPHDHPLSYLKAVILDNAPEDPLSSLSTNLIVTEILAAARQSAAEGRTVTLPPNPSSP